MSPEQAQALTDAEAAFHAAMNALAEARKNLYLARIQTADFFTGDFVYARFGKLRGIGDGDRGWFIGKVADVLPSDFGFAYSVVPLTKTGEWSNVARRMTPNELQPLPANIDRTSLPL